MTARAYVDDGLPPESVRQDALVTQLANRLTEMEQELTRLKKKVAFLEGAHTV